MKALIIAAGMGNRLEDLTKDRPKALVPVLGKELLLYQLAFLNHPAITKVGIVLGFQAHTFRQFLTQKQIDVPQFFNPHFEEGSILTLKAALPFFDDDILLMNVDHIYPKKLLDRILEQINGITAVCDFDRTLVGDDMKIKKGLSGHISRIDKKLADFDGGYIGMTVIPKEKAPLYKEAVAKSLKNNGIKSSVERVLQELVDGGKEVTIADCSGIGWLEIDNQEDLLKAEKFLKENPNHL